MHSYEAKVLEYFLRLSFVFVPQQPLLIFSTPTQVPWCLHVHMQFVRFLKYPSSETHYKSNNVTVMCTILSVINAYYSVLY